MLRGPRRAARHHHHRCAPPCPSWSAPPAVGVGRRGAPRSTASRSVAVDAAPAPATPRRREVGPRASPSSDAGDDARPRRRSLADAARLGAGSRVAWVAGAAAAGLVVGVVGARPSTPAAGRPQRSPSRRPASTPSTPGRPRAPPTSCGTTASSTCTVSTQPIDPGDGLPRGVADQQGPQADGVGRACSSPATNGPVVRHPAGPARPGLRHRRHLARGLDDAPQHSGDSVVRGTLRHLTRATQRDNSGNARCAGGRPYLGWAA